VRPAIGRRGDVRSEWKVLAELGGILGLDTSPHVSAAAVLGELAERSPLHHGLTLDEIGGRGVRWQERAAGREAAAEVLGPLSFGEPSELQPTPRPDEGSLRLVPRRDLWASPETEHAPSLQFLRPRQELVLNPADASRLGLARGDSVLVSSNGTALEAEVAPRESVKRGTCHLTAGTAEANANALANGLPGLVQVTNSGAAAR
jgi:NADH-quinone oxidoreductase subunit G